MNGQVFRLCPGRFGFGVRYPGYSSGFSPCHVFLDWRIVWGLFLVFLILSHVWHVCLVWFVERFKYAIILPLQRFSVFAMPLSGCVEVFFMTMRRIVGRPGRFYTLAQRTSQMPQDALAYGRRRVRPIRPNIRR